MEPQAFEFLSDSFLFEPSCINSFYENIAEADLAAELNRYREHRIEKAASLEAEILRNSSALRLFSGTTQPTFPFLLQAGLYLDQVVIPDPLVPFARDNREPDKVLGAILGLEKRRTINRHLVASAASYIIKLTPFLRAHFVLMLPLSTLFEPPKEIPYRQSDNAFSDVLPQLLLEFYRERAVVESVKKTPDGVVIDGTFEVGRSIHIRFEGHMGEDARGYVLMEETIESVDYQSRSVNSLLNLPITPPDTALFDRWVTQSINITAEHSYRRLLLENQLAAQYKASYLCTTPFEFELMQQFFHFRRDIPEQTANSLLKFDLPFIQQIDPSTLMAVRLEDGELFQNFRRELDRHFRELRTVKDPDELRIRTENAFHEISEVQIAQINRKMRQMKRQTRFDIAIGAAGLLSSIQTGGISLIAVAIALINGYKSYTEYLNQKEQNPHFFLWKVFNSSKT